VIAFPRKIQVTPSAGRNAAGAVVIGPF